MARIVDLSQEIYEGMPVYAGHLETAVRQHHEYPGLDASAAEWLSEHCPKIFGVDSPSPDNPIDKDYPVHMVPAAHPRRPRLAGAGDRHGR